MWTRPRLLAAQERSALLNARDIDNGALSPSEAKCQHGPSINLSLGPGPSLKFPLFLTRSPAICHSYQEVSITETPDFPQWCKPVMIDSLPSISWRRVCIP